MGTRTGYCASRRSPQESAETPAKKTAKRKRLAFMHLVEQCLKRYAQNVTHPPKGYPISRQDMRRRALGYELASDESCDEMHARSFVNLTGQGDRSGTYFSTSPGFRPQSLHPLPFRLLRQFQPQPSGLPPLPPPPLYLL